MPTLQDVQTWRGRHLHDKDHNKIGEISDIYLDRQSGEPEWLAVKTGLFGTNVSFVPIREASATQDHVMVPYDKSKVKDAPNVKADGELSPEEERRLYDHYGVEFGDFDYDRDYDAGTGMRTGTEREMRTSEDAPGTVGHDTSGPTTDRAMTRSEEEMNVGTRQRETGRARLRKFVVTENVERTVPVTREEVRVEREPITDANRGDAMEGPAISEEEHEVTLHSEEPVVEKRVVPKERVRLDKDSVTDEETVSDEVRKERIETEGDTGRL